MCQFQSTNGIEVFGIYPAKRICVIDVIINLDKQILCGTVFRCIKKCDRLLIIFLRLTVGFTLLGGSFIS